MNKFVQKLVALLLLLLMWQNIYAGNTTTTVSQVTSSVTLSSDVDYVITSTTPFTTSGSINITNTDNAVVILKNIKPSVAISNWLSYIKINGSSAVNNTNCMVKIYGPGCMILPHGSSFQPLTVYTGANYNGSSSSSYNVNTKYSLSSDATFNNSIQSFKLKRGYAVCFATQSDGGGYSRIYIADDADRSVVLESPLKGRVSWLRISKWNDVGKRGYGGSDQTANANLNTQWYYNWDAGSNFGSADREYVTEKLQRWWPSTSDVGSLGDGANILSFNEPDNSDQYLYTVDEVLSFWEDLMKEGRRLGSPAVASNLSGWLYPFIDSIDARGWRCDFVVVHCYWYSDWSSWKSTLSNIQSRTGRPLWIKEMNYGANWTGWPGSSTDGTSENYAIEKQHFGPIIDGLNSTSYIERYAAYNWVQDCRKLYNTDDSSLSGTGYLTPMGEYYAAADAGDEYNSSYEKVPDLPRQYTPVLSGSFDTSNEAAVLTWTDQNGEYNQSMVLERSTDNGSTWTTCYTVTNIAENASSYSYSDTGASFDYIYRVHIVDLNSLDRYSNTYTVSTTDYAYKKALAAAKTAVTNNESSTEGAATSAVDQYEYTDDELASLSVEEIEEATNVLNNGAVISNNSNYATSIINNADFSEGSTSYTVQGSGGVVSAPTGWTFTYSFSGWNDTKVNGTAFNMWAGTINSSDFSQLITDIPNGKYKLTAKVKCSADGPLLYANSYDGTSTSSVTVPNNSNTFQTYELTFDVYDNQVNIGVNSTVYYQISDIQLIWTGTLDEDLYHRALRLCQAAQSSNEPNSDGAASGALSQYEWTDEVLATKSKTKVNEAIKTLNKGTAMANNSQYADNSVVTNIDFSQGTTTYTAQTSGHDYAPTGWTFDFTYSGYNDTDVRTVNSINTFNAWAATITKNNLYQVVENLPNGYYRLSMDVLTYANATGVSVYAYSSSNDGESATTTVSNSEQAFGTYTCEFYVYNNTATIGINSSAFYQLQNVSLQYIEPVEEDAYHKALRLCREAKSLYESTSEGAATAALNQYEWDDDTYESKTSDVVSAAVSVLNNGTLIAANAQDATGLIQNADFTEGYSGNASGSRVQIPTDWSFTHNLSGWNDCFVDATNKCFNAWAGTISRAELYQTIKGLPNGVYRLSADVKTSDTNGTSTVALYINSDGSRVARSEEVCTTDYSSYNCASGVENNTATIGIRSDKSYYMITNIKLEYVGAEEEAETDASYLRQDYFWNGRNSLEFDASSDKYANARNVVVYPNQPNQIIKVSNNSQFENTNNKVLSSTNTCSNLVITDGYPISISNSFTAENAVFERNISSIWSTLTLPYNVSSADDFKFYTLSDIISNDEQNVLVFSSVDILTANTPGVFIGDAPSTLSFESSNITVNSTAENEVDCSNGWNLCGSYTSKSIDASSDDSYNYYYISNNQYLHATGTLSVSPFRSYFKVAKSAEAPIRYNIRIDDGLTNDIQALGTKSTFSLFPGKESVRIISGADLDYHIVNAAGALIQKGKLKEGELKDISLPAGVYIINGCRFNVK